MRKKLSRTKRLLEKYKNYILTIYQTYKSNNKTSKLVKEYYGRINAMV
mgnify:FL=1